MGDPGDMPALPLNTTPSMNQAGVLTYVDQLGSQIGDRGLIVVCALCNRDIMDRQVRREWRSLPPTRIQAGRYDYYHVGCHADWLRDAREQVLYDRLLSERTH